MYKDLLICFLKATSGLGSARHLIYQAYYIYTYTLKKNIWGAECREKLKIEVEYKRI